LDGIQIGSVVLNGQLILVLAFGAAGWLMLRYRLRNVPERELLLSWAFNAFLLWFIVWKAAYVLFHPAEAVRQPVSLVYFDGGERGEWLAGLTAAMYLGLKVRKHCIPFTTAFDHFAAFVLAGWTARKVLLLLTGTEPVWFHAAGAGFTAVLLVSLLLSSKRSDASAGAAHVIWFSLGHALLWFLVPDRSMWLLSFNKPQLICLLAAAGLTGWVWLSGKGKRDESHADEK
jgi:hypothetical protein